MFSICLRQLEAYVFKFIHVLYMHTYLSMINSRQSLFLAYKAEGLIYPGLLSIKT